jgi:hypothetical protein
MNTNRILAAVSLVALVTAIILVIVDPAFAMGRLPDPSGPGNVRGAPGPIAGAGLLTVLIGAGAYWLFKRFRKTD